MKKYYTAKQVGAMVGLTKQQIHRLRSKHFPHAKFEENGLYIRIPRADVREFLIKRGVDLKVMEGCE